MRRFTDPSEGEAIFNYENDLQEQGRIRRSMCSSMPLKVETDVDPISKRPDEKKSVDSTSVMNQVVQRYR